MNLDDWEIEDTKEHRRRGVSFVAKYLAKNQPANQATINRAKKILMDRIRLCHRYSMQTINPQFATKVVAMDNLLIPDDWLVGADLVIILLLIVRGAKIKDYNGYHYQGCSQSKWAKV